MPSQSEAHPETHQLPNSVQHTKPGVKDHEHQSTDNAESLGPPRTLDTHNNDISMKSTKGTSTGASSLTSRDAHVHRDKSQDPSQTAEPAQKIVRPDLDQVPSEELYPLFENFGALKSCIATFPQADRDLINADFPLIQKNIAQFLTSGSQDALDAAIPAAQRWLDVIPADNSMRAKLLRVQIWLRLRRLFTSDSAEDLQEVVDLAQALRALPSPPPEDLRVVLDVLAIVLGYRYRRFGAEDDLVLALQLHRDVLALPPRPALLDTVFGLNVLCNLSADVDRMFAVVADREDLQRTLTLYTRILEMHPPTSRLAHRAHCALADVHYELYSAAADGTADIDELQRALTHYAAAVEQTPRGHAMAPYIWNSFAIALGDRYEKLGAVADLHQAVILCTRAVAEHPRQSVFLAQLGHLLYRRFERLGDEKDLDQAIMLNSAVLKASAEDLERRGGTISTLAHALRARFRRKGKQEDIDTAVQLRYMLLERHPRGHEKSLTILSDLAIDLQVKLDRSAEKRDLGALQEIIRLQEEALGLCPLQHPLRSMLLGNQANSIYIRAVRKRQARDIEAAWEDVLWSISLHREALQLQSPENSHWSSSLCNLALAIQTKLRLALQRDEPSETVVGLMVEMFTLFKQAARDPYAGANMRVQHAKEWISAARECFLPAEATFAYETVVELLPDLASFSNKDPSFRLNVLKDVAGLPCDGAANALGLDEEDVFQIPGLHSLRLAIPKANYAVGLLERGRTVFWTEALRLRMPFDGLPAELAQKLKDLARVIEVVTLESTENSALSPDSREVVLSSEEATLRRRNLVDEFESLVKQAHEIPGYERLLMPKEYSQLAAAAIHGPVVVLLASTICSAAIVIKSPTADAEHISLPNVTVEHLEKLSADLKGAKDLARSLILADTKAERHFKKQPQKRSGDDKSFENVLAYLWQNVVNPVLRALELKKSHGRQRPRVWWMPTGRFVFLPIHAAGVDYGSPAVDCISDYVISSYTPTLAALINARDTDGPLQSPLDMKALLLAQPDAPGAPALPHTVDEIARIKEAIPVECNLRVGEIQSSDVFTANINVTVQQALDALPDASILHLACHGRQDRGDPLESNFLMRDGRLSVSQLISLNMPHAFLAFLSACETASGDQALPDENMNLATTMLYAGFRSVVGTMWSMNDMDGPAVAYTVYRELFGDVDRAVQPDGVAYALDDAICALRKSGAHPSRWATYIHLGM